MFGLSLSYPLPEPLVHYDVSANPTAISDLDASAPAVLPDLSGNGLDLSAENWNMKAPAWKYNPWKVIDNTRVEYQELKTGIFHITKLLVNSYGSVFNCKETLYSAPGSVMAIYSSWDKDLILSLYNLQESGTVTRISLIHKGMNIITLPEFEFPNEYPFINIKKEDYDTDDEGNPIDTPVDFYIVFFPVLDESKAYGFGEYLVPKFSVGIPEEGWFLYGSELQLVDNTHLVCVQQTLTTSDGSYRPGIYYRDEHLIVVNPFVVNLKSTVPYEYSVTYSYDYPHGEYQDVLYQQYSADGSPYISYGVAFTPLPGRSFNVDTDNFICSLGPCSYFYPGDMVQLLPYNYDHLTFLPTPLGGFNIRFSLDNSNTEYKILSTHIAKFSFGPDSESSVIKSGSSGDMSGIFFNSNEGVETPALSSYDLMVSQPFNYATVNGQRLANCTDRDLVDTVFVGSTVWIPSTYLSNFDASIFSVKSSGNFSYAKGTFYAAVCFAEALTPFQINAAMKKYNIIAEPTKYNSNFNTDSYVQAS